MITKLYTNLDVVTAAKARIKNIFRVAPKIYLSVSGGKDSICLNDLVFKMCSSGEVDKTKLIVNFIDEEAIYPCIEKQVKEMRLQWLSIGVTFNWWCIEVRHFNCLNSLTNDESFILWDRNKKDLWIRKMPKFAITEHPLLRKREDTYQKFLTRLCKDGITMIGIRASESVQRLQILAKKKIKDRQFPIYDWDNNDVWKYIKDNNLSFPKAYIYMYQCGTPLRNLRISQFFSVDTIGSLVKMCEYYPNLYDKICKREPNAYMATLYFDTELFRRASKIKAVKTEKVDYKQKLYELMKDKDRFKTPSQKRNYRYVRLFLDLNSLRLQDKHYKDFYEMLLAGDPKLRSCRAIIADVTLRYNKKVNGE